MAAGLGSRFGGVKQLARVGPDGEAIIDFSIIDALSAGYRRIVLIVRSDIEADVRAHVEARHGLAPHDAEVVYVRQDDLGPPRDKPWGTLHAVVSAAGAIASPFTVINADDYYGPSTFSVARSCLDEVGPADAVNVVFQISQTVPPAGAVTRGVVEVDDGNLVGIVETEGCRRRDDGLFEAGGVVVPATTPVSMNLWCFHPGVLEPFRERWEAFRQRVGSDPRAECQLPTVVGELMANDRLRVRVLHSTEQWIGITNPDDLELTRATLAHR